MGGQPSRPIIEATGARTVLMQDVASLFGNPQWSDLVVKCGTRQWKVHKNIICTRCDFFEKAIAGSYKEALTGSTYLDNDPVDAVHAMLSFLYRTDYDSPTGEADASPLLLHVQVWTIADKYDLPLLAEMALKKFSMRTEQFWQSPDFAKAVKEIYHTKTGSKQELRNEAIKICTKHAAALLNSDDVNICSELRALLTSNVDFASELLLSVGEDMRKRSDKNK